MPVRDGCRHAPGRGPAASPVAPRGPMATLVLEPRRRRRHRRPRPGALADAPARARASPSSCFEQPWRRRRPQGRDRRRRCSTRASGAPLTCCGCARRSCWAAVRRAPAARPAWRARSGAVGCLALVVPAAPARPAGEVPDADELLGAGRADAGGAGRARPDGRARGVPGDLRHSTWSSYRAGTTASRCRRRRR